MNEWYQRVLLGRLVEDEEVAERGEADVHEDAANGQDEPHPENVSRQSGLLHQRRVDERVQVGLQEEPVRRVQHVVHFPAAQR